MLTGSGEFTFEVLDGWAQFPDEFGGLDVTDVGAASDGTVVVFNRGEPAVIVLAPDGTYLGSWGDRLQFPKPHALAIGPDDTLWLTDTESHTVRQCSLDGEVLLRLGTEGRPSAPLSNQPFNQCTHVAIDPRDGSVFVADGYGNAAVHKFTPDGRHVLTWGSPGSRPGEFCVPHNIASDSEGNIYVADRHNSRVQVFTAHGALQHMWHDMGLAHALHVDVASQLAYLVELSPFTFIDTDAYGMPQWKQVRGVGHRISIRDLEGRVAGVVCDGGVGIGPGQLVGPHGISVDRDGSVYVAELAYSATGTSKDGQRRLSSLHKLRRVSPG